MKQKNKSRCGRHYYSGRLLEKLNKLPYVPTTVVEAPYGYGKTTAIRDYLEDMVPKSIPVHWFTVVEEAPVASFQRFCLVLARIDNCTGNRLRELDFPNAVNIGEACDAHRSL
jgi:LuxR family maltose regulon positive regulatory protein